LDIFFWIIINEQANSHIFQSEITEQF